MFLNDFFSVLQWWAVLFLLGVGFLPLTFVLFQKFFDRGYIFSKLLALSITGYIVLLLGILHLAPFTQITIISVFILLSLFLYFVFHKHILLALQKVWVVLLIEELLFFAALTAWAWIHAFSPDIHGLEKYMDYGFINSILRAEYFPPKDMWLTPEYINYYYFGHLLTALLTKISYLPSNVTFNLMLSTIFAFCFVQTFSIGANLFVILTENKHVAKVKVAIAGLLTALLTALSGNLHVLYSFFTPYQNDKVQPLWELAFAPLNFPNSYWYPNATRFIYNTIHEFPIYSWVVADLHGHVLDIPFVLLTIAVLFSLLINSKSEIRSTKSETNSNNKNKNAQNLLEHLKIRILDLFRISNFEFWYLPLIAFLLAVMYMTNAWDGAIYLLLSALVLLYISYQKTPKFFPMIRNFLIAITSVTALFVLFSLPYNSFFKPFVSGVGVLCAPDFLVEKGELGPLLFEANHCQHSNWWELLTLYGFFYFFVIAFLIFANKLKKLLITDIFVFFLIILSTFLILLPEFIYVKDIYPAHYRANTMFKLVFQAFIMLSISSAYILIRIITAMNFYKLNILNKLFAICYLLFALILLSLVLTYPYLAIKSYYGDLKLYKSLDGTAYLKTSYPTDYNAIQWLNSNIKGQPVILEAQGDSYTDYARVSANTGLPTVLGWTVHEWLWRGSYDVPSPRINEIKTLYETKDTNEALALLKKYNVEYVFLGHLEYQKYPELNEAKFTELGTAIFKDGITKIYKINN